MTIQLKPADLLFIKADTSDFSTAISESTGIYVHVAIAVDNQTVIHATLNHGVIEQPLSEFLSDNSPLDVFRLPLIESNAVISNARKHLGKPYNDSFYPDDAGFYCSQLVAAAFANQVRFPEVPMSFGDGEKQISDYWQRYFDALGVPVPLGKSGTNPDDLSKFPDLELIGTLSNGD